MFVLPTVTMRTWRGPGLPGGGGGRIHLRDELASFYPLMTSWGGQLEQHHVPQETARYGAWQKPRKQLPLFDLVVFSSLRVVVIVLIAICVAISHSRCAVVKCVLYPLRPARVSDVGIIQER